MLVLHIALVLQHLRSGSQNEGGGLSMRVIKSKSPNSQEFECSIRHKAIRIDSALITSKWKTKTSLVKCNRSLFCGLLTALVASCERWRRRNGVDLELYKYRGGVHRVHRTCLRRFQSQCFRDQSSINIGYPPVHSCLRSGRGAYLDQLIRVCVAKHFNFT